MTATADQVLDVARSWLGYSEHNGKWKTILNVYNNHKPLARHYKVTTRDSWCAAFVSACAIRAKATDIIGTECSCQQFISIFKKKGIWKEDGTIVPKKGDIILYNWDDNTQPNNGAADHIGYVEKVSGSTITAIEGNKNDAVGRRTLRVGAGNIRGYARPKYKTSSSSSSSNSSTSTKKDINTIVEEVVAGKWGNDPERSKKLEAAGYDADTIQAAVNAKLKKNSSSSSTSKPSTSTGKPATSTGKISVDGEWGKKTTAAMQRQLGTEVDGIVSHQRSCYKNLLMNCLAESWKYSSSGYSPMIKELQDRLGISKDGLIGPNTIKKLQKKLGVSVDGKVGPKTVKALQQALNNNKVKSW